MLTSNPPYARAAWSTVLVVGSIAGVPPIGPLQFEKNDGARAARGHCRHPASVSVANPAMRMAASCNAGPVGAELAIHGGDVGHRGAVAVGHDRRSWRYDCYI